MLDWYIASIGDMQAPLPLFFFKYDIRDSSGRSGTHGGWFLRTTARAKIMQDDKHAFPPSVAINYTFPPSSVAIN